jgi:putative transposase
MAQGVVACDFFVTVICSFRRLYIFLVVEHYSRRLIHCNVTAHPSALWTRQQLR